ncbi:MAG: hypothetical protein WC626_00355 [Methanoregula sp.]
MIQCDLKSLYQHLELVQNNYDSVEELLKEDLLDGWSRHQIKTDFDLKPNDFLRFAKNDLKANYEHHLINSLTNIKRTIDCQIDSIFVGLGINTKKSETEHWNFPEKIDILNKLGILSPEILGIINTQRNDLEHRYSNPNEKNVKLALDIAQLFLKYTEKYLNDMPYDGVLIEHLNIDSHLDVNLDYKNRKFRFEGKEYSKDNFHSIKNSYVKEILEENRDEYLKYLKWFLLITDMEYTLYKT